MKNDSNMIVGKGCLWMIIGGLLVMLAFKPTLHIVCLYLGIMLFSYGFLSTDWGEKTE